MFEVEERRRREKNLVIFNLEDTNSRDNDIKAAKVVIHFLNPNIETESHSLGKKYLPDKRRPLKVTVTSLAESHSLGKKYLPDKRRPLKVTVTSLDEVKAIMRNARKLNQFPGGSKIL
ncbi:hypothetical protein QE152_g9876 [Popillia japonica]|uniref:Uncharacterized protein n=1 Tax=Popillia japonica TaxID=7064 RepID=A0AAW1LWR5_POPJA